MDIVTWAARLSILMTKAKIEDEVASIGLMKLTTGSAKLFLSSLPTEVQNSYLKAIEELIKKFNAPHIRLARQNHLVTFTQGDLSPATYARMQLRNCLQYDARMEEDTKLLHVIRGLSVAVKHQIAFMTFKTAEELILALEKGEVYEVSRNEVSAPVHLANATNNFNRYKKNQHTSNNVGRRPFYSNRPRGPKKDFNSPPNENSRGNRPSRQVNRNVVCFCCGGKGHMQKVCPSGRQSHMPKSANVITKGDDPASEEVVEESLGEILQLDKIDDQ